MAGERPSRTRKRIIDSDYPPDRPDSPDNVGFSPRNPFGATIRTVTPDSMIPEATPWTRHEGFAPPIASPPTSPKANVRDAPTSASASAASASAAAARAYRMRAGSNHERGQSSLARERDPAVRPRTRTLEELPLPKREKSPASPPAQNRHRMGSGNSTSSVTSFSGIEDAVTSIGHPSITPSHELVIRAADTAARLRQGKTNARDPDSKTHTSPPSARHPPGGEASGDMDGIPLPDTSKMIKLMQSTRGRMEGPLAFRRAGNAPWAASYCTINDESGSLVYETKSADSFYRTLIPDLRGCNITQAWDAESQMLYIDVRPQNSKLKVHLRPHTQDEFENWYAALMCWHPMRPKGVQNRMAKPQASVVTDRRLQDSRRHSEVSLLKEAPIIKVGKMIFWDTNVSYSYAGTPKSAKPSTPRMQSFASRRWRRVSCTLRENGELKLYTEQDVQLVTCVQLAQLSRCAVQRLDSSVLDNDFCIAIFPQYSTSMTATMLLQPIFLSLESRVLYEAWLVLLRAFTGPELYGPKLSLSPEEIRNSRDGLGKVSSTADMFRMERFLSVRVTEARIISATSPTLPVQTPLPGRHSSNESNSGGWYAEVLLDGETRAKTMVKNDTMSPFWREEFEFQDLPAVLSMTSVLLKKRPPGPPHNERTLRIESKKMYDSLQTSDGGEATGAISFDQTFGKVDIYLDDLEPGKETEKWWPLQNIYGHSVGEALVSIHSEENIILMAKEYQPMSEVLHNFSNTLTVQLAHTVPHQLKKLSENLLNIFQVSGTASDWIMSLAEDEIDGTFKEPHGGGRSRIAREDRIQRLQRGHPLWPAHGSRGRRARHEQECDARGESALPRQHTADEVA